MKNMQPIITVSQLDCQVKSWKIYLREAITEPGQLLTKLKLSPQQLGITVDPENPFAMRVPQPFIDKMRIADPNDPLLLQVLSQMDERLSVEGYSSDPLAENGSSTPGLLHKYQARVLLILSSACAVNCRYCFRRHFPYQDEVATGKQLASSLNYIRNNSEITEVILSGGDPLIVSDNYIEQLLSQLESIPHLKRLRIHTRLPIVIPQRITAKFCQLLQASRLSTSIVFHINHPNEIDSVLHSHLKPLIESNVQLLNQSVLLGNINNQIDTLCQLSEALFSVGILPYYIHLLDKVAGAAHFAIDESHAIQLISQMRDRLPGYLVPRLAREEAGKAAKTVIG